MFHKAVFFVGHKVITVSGNCGGRSGQNILHRHSHTVDDGTIHVRSAAFQGLVHSLCRGTDGETVFRKAPKGALTIYLHKIDSVRVKLFIPVPVESFPRQRIWHDFPVCGSIQVGVFLPLQFAFRGNTLPVSAKCVPYAKPANVAFRFDICYHFPKTIGELCRLRSKIAKQLSFGRKPTVIHQHPPDRNFLFHKLAGLLTDFFFCDFSVKSIPAAPAEKAEHFRHTPLFPCSNPHALCKPGKHLVNRVCQCVCLSEDIQRFVNLGLPIQTGQHFQADFLLCSCFQICLKGFSHHGNKTRKAIRVF